MKYKCLILDHDDTVMDSTAHVHHPAFLVALAELRPGVYCHPAYLTSMQSTS